MTDPFARLRGKSVETPAEAPTAAAEPVRTAADPKPPKPPKQAKDDDEHIDGTEVPAEARPTVSEEQRILSEVARLEQLWAEARDVECPAPQEAEPEEDHDSPAYVAGLWNQRFADREWIVRLFGGPARATAIVLGDGVRIEVDLPLGADGRAAGLQFQQEALAMGVGHYHGGFLDRLAPEGGPAIYAQRDVVGTNPATEWNAAGHAAGAFFSDIDRARQRILFTAGLGIEKPSPRVPSATCRSGERGPEIVVRLIPGQDADALARGTQGALRTIFRQPELVAEVDGVDVVIRLNSRPAATFPEQTPLSPLRIHRPRTEAEALRASEDGIMLPVGWDSTGREVLIPMKDRRPHALVAGATGAGKSTLLGLQLRALQAQGCIILLADAKQGEDIADLYGDGVGVCFSKDVATIWRSIRYMYDELLFRKRMLPHLMARKVPRRWRPMVLCVDEFGALMGRADNGDKPTKAAVESALNLMIFTAQQGRSLGIHFIVSMQDATAASADHRLLAQIQSRVLIGKPEPSHLDRLFSKDERARVLEETASYARGAMGRGVVIDDQGRLSQVASYYNSGANMDLWRAYTGEMSHPRRFGWHFPDDGGEWLTRSLWAGDRSTGELETVTSIPPIWLDDEHGNPIPGREKFDAGSTLYDPGTPPSNPAHAPTD